MTTFMTRNLARYSLRREKQGYLEYLERLGNPKSMWKGFQQMHIFSGSRNTSAIPENLLSAEEINRYFLSVFQKKMTVGIKYIIIATISINQI